MAFNILLDKNMTTRLRVLSQNMYLRPGLIQHRHGDNKTARLRNLFAILHEYDVVCLQEMWYGRTALIAHAAQVGLLYYATFSKSVKTDGGLITLSRFPLTQKRCFLFKHGIFPDTMIRKGALSVLVNNSIRVINLHAQSAYMQNDSKAHRVQLAQLRATLKWAKREPQTIVLGDFNLDGLQHNLSPIFKHYVNAVPPGLPTSVVTFYKENGKEVMSTLMMCAKCRARFCKTNMLNRHMQLDHAWLTSDLTVLKCQTRPMPILSDHAGLHFVLKPLKWS